MTISICIYKVSTPPFPTGLSTWLPTACPHVAHMGEREQGRPPGAGSQGACKCYTSASQQKRTLDPRHVANLSPIVAAASDRLGGSGLATILTTVGSGLALILHSSLISGAGGLRLVRSSMLAIRCWHGGATKLPSEREKTCTLVHSANRRTFGFALCASVRGCGLGACHLRPRSISTPCAKTAETISR